MHLTGTVMTSSKSVEWLGFELGSLSLQRLRAGMQWLTPENCGLPMGSGETSLMSSFITPDNACAMSGAYIVGGNRLLHVVLWPPRGCHDRCTDRPCSHKQVCKKINKWRNARRVNVWMNGWRGKEHREKWIFFLQHRCGGSSCEICHCWSEDYGWALCSNEIALISLKDEGNNTPYNTVDASLTLFLKCLQNHTKNRRKCPVLRHL